MRVKEAKFLKTKRFVSFGWRNITLGLLSFGLSFQASAQEVFLSTERNGLDLPAPALELNGIRSDDRGISRTDVLSQALSERVKLNVVATKGLSQQFGDPRVGLTLENGLEFEFEAEDDFNNRWTSRFGSSVTRQDISTLGDLREIHLFHHRTYSLAKGWQGTLSEGLTMEFFAGVAQCRQMDDRRSRVLPFGGVRLTRDFGWGLLATGFSQGVDGGGALSGLYGSQLKRRFELHGSIPIVPGLSLNWECEVSFVRGIFEEEDLLRSAPVVVAGASLEYRLSPALKGSLGYAHRKLFSRPDRVHGPAGPMATATLTYQIF